jgi:hypothetical protein
VQSLVALVLAQTSFDSLLSLLALSKEVCHQKVCNSNDQGWALPILLSIFRYSILIGYRKKGFSGVNDTAET